MGFKYKSTMVTLENYRNIFKECSPDIIDEIRSAVLDDTDISKFIKLCGTDSYKLGQIRMALRELIPKEYLNTRFTGRTIYLIRQGFSKGLDMSGILKYANVKGMQLDAEVLEKLTEYMLIGVDITKVDFTLVPTNLVDIMCKGLYQGYPMWLCINEDNILTESKVRMLLRGMQLGVDIHPFVNGEWSTEQMVLFLSYAKQVDLNMILSNVNANFSVDELQVLLSIASKGASISTLCVKDMDEKPIYNQFQMFVLGEAILDGTICQEMYKASLSDMDMEEIHQRELKKKNRKLQALL